MLPRRAAVVCISGLVLSVCMGSGRRCRISAFARPPSSHSWCPSSGQHGTSAWSVARGRSPCVCLSSDLSSVLVCQSCCKLRYYTARKVEKETPCFLGPKETGSFFQETPNWEFLWCWEFFGWEFLCRQRTYFWPPEQMGKCESRIASRAGSVNAAQEKRVPPTKTERS